MHIGPNNKAMITLEQLFMSKNMRNVEKPHGENPPSRKDMRGKPKMMLMLLQIKFLCLEEYSSWEEEKYAHLDQ